MRKSIHDGRSSGGILVWFLNPVARREARMAGRQDDVSVASAHRSLGRRMRVPVGRAKIVQRDRFCFVQSNQARPLSRRDWIWLSGREQLLSAPTGKAATSASRRSSGAGHFFPHLVNFCRGEGRGDGTILWSGDAHWDRFHKMEPHPPRCPSTAGMVRPCQRGIFLFCPSALDRWCHAHPSPPKMPR